MKKIQHKRQFRKIVESKPVLVILCVFLVFFIFNIIKLVNKASETKQNRDVAQDKINELEKQKEDLEQKIQKLSTEKGVEEDIREKFGLGKEGEGMVVIVEDENKIKTEEVEKNGGFWGFFKKIF